MDVPDSDGERDAGHVEVRLVVGVVRQAIGVTGGGVEGGEHRPDETFVVIVIADVDDRLPTDDLLGSGEVRRSVKRLVRRHVDGDVHDDVQRPTTPC